jgi:hypothetical protein
MSRIKVYHNILKDSLFPLTIFPLKKKIWAKFQFFKFNKNPGLPPEKIPLEKPNKRQAVLDNKNNNLMITLFS